MYFPWQTLGHERQKQEIEKNILENNITHAYLFSGPRGVGKLYFAKEFARALLCKNQMCRTCADCRQMDNLTHPDFLILDMLYIEDVNTDWNIISKFSNVSQESRATGVKAKSDRIGIETIRALQEKLQEKSLGGFRVCIINNIDRITPEATNAFLKTVEEPPKNVLFIFTTSRESSLLPTLLSRMRVIRFNTLYNDIIAQKIKGKFGEKEELSEILQYAQGRIDTAWELAENRDKLIAVRTSYQKITSIFEERNITKQFEFAEKLSENVDELQIFFEHAYFYLRSKIAPKQINLVTTIEELEKTEQYIQMNVNKKLALENFFLKVSD